MPTFRESRTVPHSPEAMFDLVADVEKYPLFLPFCEDLKVLRRSDGEGGEATIVAVMTVGYKAIRESFTSKVTLDPARRRILVEYVDGPFKFLENRWTFLEDPAGCKVDFWISYEFKNRMLGLLVGALFDKAFRRFVTAFEERARVVHGAR